MKIYIKIILLIFFFTLSCSSLIEEEEVSELKKIEKKIYVLKHNFSMNNYSLKKGDLVEIAIIPGDDWVKVYAFKTEKNLTVKEQNENRLKSQRVRILYLFEDDFNDEEFNKDFFFKKLYMKVDLSDN
jgi:type II secretion system-associated lipoprotein